MTIDELEKAFLKDAIPEADYTEICERSLKQYNSILKDETVAAAYGSLDEFKQEWDVRLFLPFSPPPLASLACSLLALSMTLLFLC